MADIDLRRLRRPTSPTLPVPLSIRLFRLFVHPSHFHNTFSAKISPNHIITPVTNGKKRLVASDPMGAATHVLVVRGGSKIGMDADIHGGCSRP